MQRDKIVNKKAIIFLISVIIATAALVTCYDKKTDKKQDKIIYAMPITLAAIPAYVALEKGFWKDEGLDVEAKMFSSGRLALDALIARDAEVMSVSETPLVHAILKGNSIFIIATVTQHKEVKLIARTDHGIKKPEDLKGKKIATLPGTNSDYFMYEFLNKYNIAVDEVQIINLQPPDMVVAFVNGDIDAYFAWEPHIYYAQNKIPGETTIFNPENLYSGRHTVAMNQDFVNSNPSIVEKIIKGFISAEKFIKEDPESAMAITSKITGMPVNALKDLWPEYEARIALDSDFLQILIKEGKWALSLEKSKVSIPDFINFIYSDALYKVRASSVNLKNE